MSTGPPAISDLEKEVLEEMGGPSRTPEKIFSMMNCNKDIAGNNWEWEQRIKVDEVEKALESLKSWELVEYLGHEEYKRTERGRRYVEDELVPFRQGGSKRLASKLNGGLFDIIFHVLFYSLTIALVTTILLGEADCGTNIAPCLTGVIIVPVLLLITGLHLVDQGKVLYLGIVRYLPIENPIIDNIDNTKVRNVQQRAQRDAAASAFANGFHLRGFELLVGFLWISMLIDFTTQTPGQIYGLIFTIFGSLLLALGALRSTGNLQSSGLDLAMSDASNESLQVNEGVWGTSALVVGFLLQIFAIIPWRELSASLPII